MIAENTVKNFRGLLFAAPCIILVDCIYVCLGLPV